MNPDEVKVTEITDISNVYQQDKASIDMQITTAKTYPRNIMRATDNAIAIVGMDEETAQTCVYSIPRGGKQITGASVHLAKILAQVWGNLRVEARVVDIDQKHITSQAIAFDLENNLAIKVEVKRSIVGKYGRFNDDMITVTGNASNSIAMRNAILSVIPRSVVEKVYKTAQNVITGDVSDEQKLKTKRKEVVDKLKDTYSVTVDEILSAIGKASIDHIDREDLVTLIGVGQAIKDGDTTVESAFKGKKDVKEDITKEQLKELMTSKLKSLSEKEIADANRIIDGEEKLSYQKLHNLLSAK